MNKPVIDLNGRQKNGFYLIIQANSLIAQLKLKNGKAILADMTAGKYDHLVDTFERHFGEFVTIIRPEST